MIRLSRIPKKLRSLEKEHERISRKFPKAKLHLNSIEGLYNKLLKRLGDAVR